MEFAMQIVQESKYTISMGICLWNPLLKWNTEESKREFYLWKLIKISY